VNKEETKVTGYGTNILIWAALVALTGATIIVSGLDLGKYSIIGNFLIASLKAGLVLYIFMHMKYESIIIKLMLAVVLITMTSILLLTFMDILYR
jgi:cytochrome c oxidase subunit 4